MKNGVRVLLFAFFIAACSSNKSSIKSDFTVKSMSKNSLYSKVLDNIDKSDLDTADDSYIELKTSSEDKQLIADAATNLAIAHIAKGENILANFYIQEALLYNPSNEMLRFLLVKNQFLAAAKSSNETTYLQKALDALKTNRALVASYDYGILANSNA